jgi:outer membrane protein OmpA-like peptidoglycan-associated protein
MKPRAAGLYVIICFALILAILMLLGCQASNMAKGTAIGAGAGAAIGLLLGSQTNNSAVGAIIGAGVGGATGAVIGHHMDKQAEELKADLKGAQVERIGEGIKITFDSGLMIEFNSFVLNAASRTNLTSLAKTLNKYDDTNILAEGHTDKTGREEYNMKLSEERALAVTNYLSSMNVKRARITTVGYGESQPVSENDAMNRRVEIAIYANKKMKKLADKGGLGQ